MACSDNEGKRLPSKSSHVALFDALDQQNLVLSEQIKLFQFQIFILWFIALERTSHANHLNFLAQIRRCRFCSAYCRSSYGRNEINKKYIHGSHSSLRFIILIKLNCTLSAVMPLGKITI